MLSGATRRSVYTCVSTTRPPDTIAHEDEVVLLHDHLARHGLRKIESVLDDLEHDVERQQREHRHDCALIALRHRESRIRMLRQMPHEAPVEHRLAMPVVADR